jgi:AhpC/TSA family
MLTGGDERHRSIRDRGRERYRTGSLELPIRLSTLIGFCLGFPTMKTLLSNPLPVAVLVAGICLNAGARAAEVGQSAPDFCLTDIDGVTHRLSDCKGKLIVLEWVNPELGTNSVGSCYQMQQYQSCGAHEISKLDGHISRLSRFRLTDRGVAVADAIRLQANRGFPPLPVAPAVRATPASRDNTLREG